MTDKKKINTVLFDFDGTLVNTNDVIVASWQHTYMHYLGREETLEKITACFGEPLLLTMEREFPELTRRSQRRYTADISGNMPMSW